MTRRLVGVVLVLVAFAAFPGPAPGAAVIAIPPPAVAPLVPLAALALDKPPVDMPPLGLPDNPQAMPELPLPRGVTALRPIAPLPPPRALACNPLGTLFGVPSELVECGRARFQAAEYDEAFRALQSAVQRASDRLTLREARYWLAESLFQLKRVELAEHHLRLVSQDDPRGELGLYATHALAWLELGRPAPARALGLFEQLLRGSVVSELVPYARHGQAAALHSLGRYEEARDQWTGLLLQSIPRPLATEATFWLGDALGRLGDHAGAVARLEVVAAAGPHLFTEPGLVRLGWWSRAAGRPLEAVKTFRGLLATYPISAETAWARAGLALALLDLGDAGAARTEVRELEALDPKGALALPTLLTLARWAAERGRTAEAEAIQQDLLSKTLEPATRGWVLVLQGETLLADGRREQARSPFELVESIAPGTPFAWQAGLRLAEMDLSGREFERARTRLERLLRESLPPGLRRAALLLAAEAAYWSSAHERAASLYVRFLGDFPGDPLAPQAVFALGWAEFRRGRLEAARERWARFAEDVPTDPRAPAALSLAAELTAKAGNLAGAEALLDRLIGRHAESEHADVARLNRAVLAIRADRPAPVLADLDDLVRRARLSPLIGRIRVVRGVALQMLGRRMEAERELRLALGQGEDALARLALGGVAVEERQWDVAAREFQQARAQGTAPVARAAEYGLAAVAFHQGKPDELKRWAEPLVADPPMPATTPHLLYALAVTAADEKRWPDGRGLALRLVAEFPTHPGAPEALARLGTAASREANWPVAREAYQLLAARYPQHEANAAARLDFAEALFQTGAAGAARPLLQAFVEGSPGDPRMPRALNLLARAMEATGDRVGAARVYGRLGRDYPATTGAPTALFEEARLLQQEGKWAEARPALERALANPDPAVASEAAFKLGEGLRAAGQHEEAVEFYMTAAYTAPESAWGRRALLGAAQSFTALKQPESAAVAYRKLLAASDLEPELRQAAERGLKGLGVN